MPSFAHCRVLFLALAAVTSLAGCNSTPGAVDPWEKTNRAFYDFDEGLDRFALKPLSDGYIKIVPKPARTSLNNAFNNLLYANVILNDFLQGKWNQGWSDSGRMAVNSTIGVAGLFDVASPWGMVSHDNDFGITLGKWGVQQGPYMVLPLFGPSCVRDVPGIGVQLVTDPIFWINPPLTVTIPLETVHAIDARANAEIGLRFRDEAALDPYVFTRDAYLQFRRAQIQEGQVPVDQSMYDEDAPPPPATRPKDPAAPSTMPTTGR